MKLKPCETVRGGCTGYAFVAIHDDANDVAFRIYQRHNMTEPELLDYAKRFCDEHNHGVEALEHLEQAIEWIESAKSAGLVPIYNSDDEEDGEARAARDIDKLIAESNEILKGAKQ